MLLKVYAVRDGKSDAYGTPFFQPTRGLALRSFIDLARDPQSVVSKHAQDFALFELGEVNLVTGVITASVQPEFLGCASDLLTASEVSPSNVLPMSVA